MIATRNRAWDYSGSLGLLPNPDPVLRKLDDAGVEVLEALTADAHVMSVIQTRKLGSLKREFRFLPGREEQGEVTPFSERVHLELTRDLAKLDLYQVISEVLNAPYFGMTPLELVWKPENKWIRLAGLRALPARWFGFDEDNKPRFLAADNPFGGEKLPYGKFVFARHFPSYDNPFGLRLLSRCLWPVTFKKNGLRFWAMLAEKYGIPFLLGKVPGGTPVDQQQEFLSGLARAVRDAVMVVPDGSQVEIKEANLGNSARIHSQLVSAMNLEISKVILGQTLTTEAGDKGSHAASKTHKEVLDHYLEADQKLVKWVMNQIASLYTEINLPQGRPPRFQWYEEEDIALDRAQRDKDLVAAGVRFSRVYYQRKYGLSDDEFALAQE